MSLQWALVATFLYVEIAFIILLLLPLIPARAYVLSMSLQSRLTDVTLAILTSDGKSSSNRASSPA